MGSLLESVQQVCLVICIVIVPLTTAWAKELGVAILFLTAAVLMTVGAVRAVSDKKPGFGSLTPIVLAGVACVLVLMQLFPLPQSVLRTVTPFQQQAFEAWPDLSAVLSTPSEWNTISLTPHLTASGLALASAYFMLIGGLWFYLRSSREVSWLIWLIAVSTAGMAAIGMCQLLFGNGKFLWLFENPMRSVEWPAKGTFTNQNHFASFLALGVGCCLFQALGTRETVRKTSRNRVAKSSRSAFARVDVDSDSMTLVEKVWGGVTILVLLAAVLSFSRGGIAAIIVAMAVACFGFRSRLSALSRFLVPAIAFCVLGLVAFGSDVLTSKWDRLVTSTSLSDVSAGRVALWKSILDAAPSFAMAGSGAGSHAEVYPVWMVEDFGKRFSHAENGYLQILLEMGLPGLLLLAAVLFVVIRKLVTGFQTTKTDRHLQTPWVICLAGILASLFHSLTDFVWYIPACMLVTLTLLVVLFRSAEIHLQSRNKKPVAGGTRMMPWASFVIVGAIVALGTSRVVADARSEGHWLVYRGLAIDSSKHLDNGVPQDQGIDEMIAALESCLAADPQDSRATSDLSILYLRRFESQQAKSDNPMSVAEIRSTVKSVGFDSRRETLQWLVKAFGTGVSDLFRATISARSAMAGQPLRASPYLALHQLSFLITDDPEVEERLMQQTLILRPHSASIRYAAGIADLEAGRLDSGFQRLAFAFQKDRSLRPIIVNQMLEVLPVAEVVDVLDTDSEGLLQVFNSCRKLSNADMADWVAIHFREKFKDATHPPTYSYWNSASQIFSYLKDYETEIICLKKALVYRPNSYSVRRMLALRMADFGDVDQGIAALKACLIRKPDDAAVKSRLHKLVSSGKHDVVEMTN